MSGDKYERALQTRVEYTRRGDCPPRAGSARSRGHFGCATSAAEYSKNAVFWPVSTLASQLERLLVAGRTVMPEGDGHDYYHATSIADDMAEADDRCAWRQRAVGDGRMRRGFGSGCIRTACSDDGVSRQSARGADRGELRAESADARSPSRGERRDAYRKSSASRPGADAGRARAVAAPMRIVPSGADRAARRLSCGRSRRMRAWCRCRSRRPSRVRSRRVRSFTRTRARCGRRGRVKKSAIIIGSSAGAGAGVGAAIGGKKGALIGAAIGGGGATLWDQLTRR